MSSRTDRRVGGKLSQLISKLRDSEFKRFLKFGLVGGTGVVVNQGFAALGMYVVFVGLSDGAMKHAAVLLGITVSIFTNFVLNDRWTWSDRAKPGKSHWFKRLVLYYAFASIAAGLQVIVTASLSQWFFEWHLLVANFFGIGSAVLINYEVNNRWTFADRAISDGGSNRAVNPPNG